MVITKVGKKHRWSIHTPKGHHRIKCGTTRNGSRGLTIANDYVENRLAYTDYFAHLLKNKELGINYEFF